MNPQEITDIIVGINQEIYECLEKIYEDNYLMFLQFHTDGYCYAVEFMGIQIWSSEDCNEDFSESENEEKAFEGYLLREIKKIQYSLSLVSVKLSEK